MGLGRYLKLGIKQWKWNLDTLEKEVGLEQKEDKLVCSHVRIGRQERLRVPTSESQGSKA